ncbi:glycosyltransferase [Clostridium perfringens]|uniref:glycosyltransferase n=1 Tax=Clostridium perfringens TaxID=1502 RepID=UPI0018E486ED|nr:glycosyltransferase [Clostridium perfringens]MBI6066234.1 glycosyltransferase family 4 protein [Clostridium perfringens]MDK0606748.1 glycosyltransferase [Clostridium perfringens]MDZ5031027.1 glycosyltransferase [Clostridium perfringens]
MGKVLIISPMEYGTQTDHIFWCKYLKKEKNVSHLSYGKNFLNQYVDGIRIIMLSNVKKFRKLKLVKYASKMIKKNNYEVVIIDYFPGCSLLKLFNNKQRFILDIRSGTIKSNKLLKNIRDILIRMESCFFKEVTIIDKKLSEKLKVKKSKIKILPLGSDCFFSLDDIKRKEQPCFTVVYVGSFIMRNIEQTLEAFKILKERGYEGCIKYILIGSGINQSYDNSIKKYIDNNKMTNMIDFVGRIPHNELKKYFIKSNIGLSYIPITKYFDLQPPTKTYEYIINGLFCIATKTKANKDIVNNINGVLIDDNAIDLANAIELTYKNFKQIDPIEVHNTLKEYTWENIVNNILINIINNRKDI